MTSRRDFLGSTAAAVGAAIVLPGSRFALGVPDEKPNASKGRKSEVSAPEDLMREHGVLNRLLLIYEEGLRRLAVKRDVPFDALHAAAELM